MMSKNILTENDELEIVGLYKNKSWYTISKLAKKFNVTIYRINKILEKHKVEKRKINSSEFNQYSFCLFLLGDKSKINQNELAIATEMLQRCKDGNFWQYIKLPFFRSSDDGKMPSLLWFKTEGGKNFLRYQWGKYNKEKENRKFNENSIETTWEPEKPKEYELEEKPLIKLENDKRIKSLQEFLQENSYGKS